MKILSILSVLTLFVGCGSTQNDNKNNSIIPAEASTKVEALNNNFVNASEIKEVVSFLASDALKGRDTGTEEINEAANYIETQFKSFGVKPYFETYRDNFKVENMDAYNVVGYLEGTDAKLKNEFIIIGAHYDHIGTAKGVNGDTIANGANDNAAGTSGVLFLAKYFAKTKTNKRSIIFTTFTAEEKGLLGSKHLAEKLKENNINLYTMINIEMIGVPFKDRDYQAFITGHELSNLAEKMNSYAGEKLIGASSVSKKYGLFKRSDNYAFYQAFKVPSHTVSSCDLTNFDFYHHVDDEVDKLDYNFMASLINKLAPVIQEIANTPSQEIKMNEN
ncbi:M28 family peptidase [Lacinutrix sp. MedPE-SW]|uniref:M28 family metallopeptidase n=1 Tax=Lacinutrix sp. MedPE-SW TaxID=1860087 RepID=UPI00091C2955|nr:M28 family peptidase [Lacinutrix sp. MedPE-SW]OIQ18830.1 MAG: peptidase M28 [Lacinutrix sp. MedPE-SW]